MTPPLPALPSGPPIILDANAILIEQRYRDPDTAPPDRWAFAEAVRALADGGRALVPAMVETEIMAGNGGNRISATDGPFSDSHIVAVDPRDFVAAGRFLGRRRNRPGHMKGEGGPPKGVGGFDALLAAVAKRLGHPILTDDQGFQRLRGTGVRLWVPPAPTAPHRKPTLL